VVACGGNVFGAAIAVAEPSDLACDIGAYDNCMNKTIRDTNQCCVDSRGMPSDEPLDGGNRRSRGVGSADCSARQAAAGHLGADRPGTGQPIPACRHRPCRTSRRRWSPSFPPV